MLPLEKFEPQNYCLLKTIMEITQKQ